MPTSALQSWRFGGKGFPPYDRELAERLKTCLIEILELLVEAAYSRDKSDLLKRANLRIAVVRHLWRMAHELKPRFRS